jgi:hypothetical protein
MSCEKCRADGTFHSFEFIGRAKDSTKLIYTCPAKAKEKRPTEDSVRDYIDHMDEVSLDGWIWLFDCRGIESLDMPNLKVLKQFTELVQERYKFVLKKVLILNVNWKMQMILSMVKPFMKEGSEKRIIVCKSPLELLDSMESELVKKVFHNQ